MNNLGYAYYIGSGVEKDLYKLKEWLTKAANLGNQSAKDRLKK